MEHLKFFDLPSDPFQNESDERFYYESAPQKRARLRLLRGIHQHKALSVLVGGPGLGKTTLAHSLLRALDPREFAAHYLSIPHEACSSGWFLPNVARAFGVHAPSAQIQMLIDQVHAQLGAIAASRRSAVLLVDEAQLFRNRDAMEEFRGLLNLLHDGKKLVSLVLFGMPELGDILRLDPPLAQRVEIRVELTAMDWLESQAYVAHRLRLAGATQAVFAPDALEALFRWSGGVPRVLNTLADNALFEAFLSEAKPVDASIVAAAAEALGLVATRLEDSYPGMTSMPSIPSLEGELHATEPGTLTAIEEVPAAAWLEPLAPMPVDVPDLGSPSASIAAAEDTSPEYADAEFESAEIESAEIEVEASAMPAAEAIEFELEEEILAEPDPEPEPELEIEVESAPIVVPEAVQLPESDPEPATEIDPGDSDWSLGALVREEEASAEVERKRNEDSFDLRSLALEVEDEEEAIAVPAAPPMAAPAASEKAREEDDLDALFDGIQIND
jgi:general secretion pathway protein A